MKNPEPELADPGAASVIRQLIDAARSELTGLNAQLDPLLTKRGKLVDTLSALEHVYSLYTNSEDVPADAKPASGSAEAPLAAVAHIRPATGSIRETVRGQVMTILAETNGEAMHIVDIAKAFETRGWPIPGAGVPANITAHLSGAPDIFSPKRGFWAIGHKSDSGHKGQGTRVVRRRVTKRRG